MARPRKVGLEYFPLDCVLDEKFEALEDEFGNDGFAVVIKIFQSAYQTSKGEVDLNEPLRRRVLIRRSGVKEERFMKIVSLAVAVGIFDATRYEKGVLTSRGIKRRITTIEKERKRSRNRYESFTARNSGETPVKRGEKTRETGERKEKEIKLSIKESARARGKDAKASRAALEENGAAPDPVAVREILHKAGF